ncbi:MAG: hypothetical protein LBU38_02635 [Propionibacteriaceae bacterium]|jgi:uncharacterized protein with PQ loop repeat|nr:hypothetical protein [Propionibacteriaceae bacterium]
MEPAFVLGWAGAFTSTVLGIPQLVRLLRTKDARGLSVFFWQLKLTGDLIWGFHGALIGQMNMLVPNVFSCVVTLMVLWALHKEHHRPFPALVVPGLALAVVMVAIDLCFGTFWFGVATSVLPVIGHGGQSIDLIRSPKVSGISPMFLIAFNVNQVFWICWAILILDAGSLITGISTGVMVAFNLIWWLLRKLGLPALSHFPSDPEGDLADGSPAGHLNANDESVTVEPVICGAGGGDAAG